MKKSSRQTAYPKCTTLLKMPSVIYSAIKSKLTILWFVFIESAK